MCETKPMRGNLLVFGNSIYFHNRYTQNQSESRISSWWQCPLTFPVFLNSENTPKNTWRLDEFISFVKFSFNSESGKVLIKNNNLEWNLYSTWLFSRLHSDLYVSNLTHMRWRNKTVRNIIGKCKNWTRR